MSIRIGICLFLFTACFANISVAQTDLATLCESWSSCNSKMTEKYKALDEGDATPGLADEYRDLVDEANDLIQSMRKQGLAELKERPGDGKVIRALLGIMVHDAQSGRDAMVLDVGQALIDAKINPKYFEAAANLERLELSQKPAFEELSVRHKDAMADDLPRVKLNTTAGEIVLELFENEAPNTVRNFVSLVESGHYSDKLFHRVIENFMAQGGGFETEGIGSGGPGYQIDCECKAADARLNFTGTISMAHAGRDTGGSQFFLNFRHNKRLDGNHTVFGRIVSGMNVLDKIERTELLINGMERPIEQAKPDRILSAEVVRKRNHSYRVRKKGEPELPEEPVESLKLDEESNEPEMKEDADSDEQSDSEESDAEAEKAKSDDEDSEAESKKAESKKEADGEDAKEAESEKEAKESEADDNSDTVEESDENDS